MLPSSSSALGEVLDPARGPVLPPIRSELFGPERFGQHGRSLGDTHRAAKAGWRAASFFPRLRSNIAVLREAHAYIGVQAATGYDISPAAEWLLDNFHLIEAQLKEVHEGLPRSYFRALPVLIDAPLAGLPRIYGVAWAFVAHTDGAFDEALLQQFLQAYQETRELSLSELWALPTTLRVVLIENLRRLAECVATQKAAREVANLCCDRLEDFSADSLDELLHLLEQRGVQRVFLAQMSQRLQDHRSAARPEIHEWLRQALAAQLASGVLQGLDITGQAADNLSVSNAVTSLRAIGDADWSELIASSSALMQLMLKAPLFEAEHATTRDQTLHRIERLARRSGRSELSVAHSLLALMPTEASADDPTAAACYWLLGAGRPTLAKALGLHEQLRMQARRLIRRLLLPAYLGALLAGTVGLVSWLLMRHGTEASEPAWLLALGAVLAGVLASEAVLAVMNRIISESTRPQHLPRLALTKGIAESQGVMVVIPAMLSSPAGNATLTHRLLLHYLANPEAQAQFALLSDWVDADHESLPQDAVLLADALLGIEALNTDYPTPAGQAPRFILLHRPRRFSQTEQRWIGWERKRGKLEQLIAVLAREPGEGRNSAFLDLGHSSQCAAGLRYIVTLDADTQLPPGRLRDLVGVAAHPYNQPRLDATGQRVLDGYAILQPRVATPLPSLHEMTHFHWLFAGRCGIDTYSAASSEVYQDLFDEGSFSGKGLLDVKALHRLLGGRLPEGQVLSHDLLEGSLSRCASVNDITLLEDAPFHPDVANSRVQRWTRGDWQLLPFIVQPRRYPMRAVNRWKMIDNLRRSLVAPAGLALLALALLGLVISPWAVIALVLAAFGAGPLMGALAGFSSDRPDLAHPYFYRQALIELQRSLNGSLWHLAQLQQQAVMALTSIGQALYRMGVSRRHLLQWTTSAEAQAAASDDVAALLQRHRREPVLALLLLALLLPFAAYPVWTAALCLIWAFAPLWTLWASRHDTTVPKHGMIGDDGTMLEGVARDTWRLFERYVGAEDRHLPPDNVQVLPLLMVAHRTSPTNIGLYLLSVACARQFGWIGTQDLLGRMEATLATLATLQRHKGHFLNWYDTQTGTPLLPMYVSSVDSGNLCGHLLAVAAACRELSAQVLADSALLLSNQALSASKRRLTPGLLRWQSLLQAQPGQALLRLLDMQALRPMDDELAQTAEAMLLAAAEELAGLWPQHVEPGLLNPGPVTPEPAPRESLLWLLADHLATLRSALLDLHAQRSGRNAQTIVRLQDLAQRCEALAWEPDFGFLYHRKRHLLHIGYRVAEQQLDAGFYDLLASESRLTSLLAIAKGDVPVRHWAALGRPFYAVGMRAGLRSWSGSMFEYLMPTLVLTEPPCSVLREACEAALQEQMAFTAPQGLPWGISESAYAARDQSLAYQYAPQGVPRLALRRTPPDELVIAPYATALAAQLHPHRACRNFEELARLGTRERLGFIEALDFTALRQAEQSVLAAHAMPLRVPFTPVGTFMSHHQGMSIVALANVLLDGIAQRWGMSHPRIEAVASLLHERAPREVARLPASPKGPPLQMLQRRIPGLLREVAPGMQAVEPTHLLSNGNYHVSLRANGSGWSRWGETGLTRWRDDALRDAHGSHLFVRREPGAVPVSLSQHPAPDSQAQYQSFFHPDRVCLLATWPDLQTHTTVWVSPEDDVEFRQVELRNLSDQAITLELISAFEVTLSTANADEAHPAFANLFISAAWQAEHQALLFERKPRLPDEPVVHLAHFLTQGDTAIQQLRVQTDRLAWLGRQRGANQPLASLAEAPSVSAPLETGLDPVCVLAVSLRIAPHGTAQITFATSASQQAEILHAVIDKYRQPSHVQRASLMSATLTSIRLRALRLTPDNFAAIQSISTALLLTLAKPLAASEPSVSICDRRQLWRHAISGDQPIILVSVADPQDLNLLRALAQAMSLWAWSGIACDLVVLNAEALSYEMPLHREVSALRERFMTEAAGDARRVNTRFHLLRSESMDADELASLQSIARLWLHADGRPLRHHVQEWIDAHERALVTRQHVAGVALKLVVPVGSERASVGRFEASSGDFCFNVGALAQTDAAMSTPMATSTTAGSQRPQRPWVNVMANPGFGCMLSEAGGGYTWAVNSRMNQLTAWSNDAVADPPSEWFLLQETRSGKTWSLTASAWADPAANYEIAHGQGITTISHKRGDLQVSASWCVDAASSIKQVRVRVHNLGKNMSHLRLVGMLEWMMGANRRDRASVHTAWFRQRLPGQKLGALLCTQRDHAAGFGDGTAFLALADTETALDDWTCDRRELFDARGRLHLPDHFGQAQGSGMDPCAALSTRLSLEPGEMQERVFLIGHASSPEAARRLATKAAAQGAEQRSEQVRQRWRLLLEATVVHTPDPLFDAMVNHWLLYQTVACRMWAKAGFYQAGGATGFRDHLQDAMALSWAAPEMLREQILLSASRQFAAGDVQHWWHSPGGAGVRTHCSDDLLWLAHACVHYVQATGDLSLLDERVAFLEGLPIPDGAEDIYDTPHAGTELASVFEHAARAIDRSLRVGVHGLPLIGSGDWNDGMNRVGAAGRGESVWLAWFLSDLVADMAPLAMARGEAERATRWQHAAEGWREALLGPAWDGDWFKRAFFDDGQPLGSKENTEGRIDLIAQAWSVLSGAAPASLQQAAMRAAQAQLVDTQAGLIQLLTPPLARAQPSAGYIQAYPPGVRENGGQYSHAGVWALLAQTQLSQAAAQAGHAPESAESADLAYRYFTYLSPAHRAQHKLFGNVYAIEPYVMAGDVYTQPPYTGRGGWSWYTGSAAWMHRAAIEAIFGLKLRGQVLHFEPCLPTHWPRAELTLRRAGRRLRFVLLRGSSEALQLEATHLRAGILQHGQTLNWATQLSDSCFVVAMETAPALAKSTGAELVI